MLTSKQKHRVFFFSLSGFMAVCSVDSWSSYTDFDDTTDDGMSPRERSTRQCTLKGFTDFCVRDINQATVGRHEIEYAELEMSGILTLREKAKPDTPLKGARIVGEWNLLHNSVLLERGGYFLSFLFSFSMIS